MYDGRLWQWANRNSNGLGVDYCVRGTRMQPLTSVGCSVQWKSEVFSDCICVDIDLPRFEALAYVLPHFDMLTHVVICVSSAFIFKTCLLRSVILSSWSSHLSKLAEVASLSLCIKPSSFKILLNFRKACIFQEFAEDLLSLCVCWIFESVQPPE